MKERMKGVFHPIATTSKEGNAEGEVWMPSGETEINCHQTLSHQIVGDFRSPRDK